MPRKHPVSAIDLAIANRLEFIRLDRHFSRGELAARARIAPGIIARVELGRMALRYLDAKKLLRGLSAGGPIRTDLRPVSPLWLAEGKDPIDVNWPLILPDNHHLGAAPSASFSSVISAHRALLYALINDPTTALLPESWLAPYLSHWENFRLHAITFGGVASLLERLFLSSVEKLDPKSTQAAILLADYRAALAEIAFLQSWKAKKTNLGLAWFDAERDRGGNPEEKEISQQVLTVVSGHANLPDVKSPLAQLLERLNQATAVKGRKAELAKHLNAPRPCVSDWLSGKREPSGETTLRLLQWVEQQERQQNKSADSVSAPPAPKTQSKVPNEKKPKSGRQKE
jgi:transcriptional regulator with XRE-family HTH domain